MLFNGTMQFTRKGLQNEGFLGFRPVEGLEFTRIPQRTGLVAVLAPAGFQPRFLQKSTAGIFKKKDPSLPLSALEGEWVPDAAVRGIRPAPLRQPGAGPPETRPQQPRLTGTSPKPGCPTASEASPTNRPSRRRT